MKKKIFVLSSILFSFWCTSVCAELSESELSLISSNFLSFKSSDLTPKSILPIEKNAQILGYIISLDSPGYLLIPANRSLPPIKAYSLKSDFETLPSWYKDFLVEELEYFHENRNITPRAVSPNAAKWDFLLNFTGRQPRYTAGEILITAHWNQRNPYNKKLPKIDGKTVVTGCVQVAQAQVMHYHQHPARGIGIAYHEWNGKSLESVLYKNYFWESMPDAADADTPEHLQDEIALLLKDIAIVNGAEFGLSSTSTSLNKIGFMRHFGYATDMKTMDNQDEAAFFAALKDEIDNDRPVLLSLPGHMVVADGYADNDPTGKSIHLNMGWGGHDDDFYVLNENIVTTQYSFPPNLDIIYNVRPCNSAESNCFSDLSALETGDSVSGSVISGEFNSEYDIDSHSVYLKGNTIITGDSGNGNQFFYVMVYGNGDTVEISSKETINQTFAPGKYEIWISLKNEDGAGYNYPTNFDAYTVNISTETLNQEELDAIDHLDVAPEIHNIFSDIVLSSAYSIRIDATDKDGDQVALSAVSSSSDIDTVISNDVLTLTSTVSAGYGQITVTATANGKQVHKTFMVLVNDTPLHFGNTFTINGIFENQQDFNQHAVFLDGECTISGDRGYSNQAFYSSVLDENGNYLVPMNDAAIVNTFNVDTYSIGASLQQNPGSSGMFYKYEEDTAAYTFFVSCPDSTVTIEDVAAHLGISIQTSHLISGHILDVNGNGIPAVAINFSNGYGSVMTNDSGAYQLSVSSGWSGTASPAKEGFIFAPPSRTYSALNSDHSNENYNGLLLGDVDHSGEIDLSDAILSLRVNVGIGTITVFADADVNNDDRVGLEEAIFCLRVLSQ